ncbi:MAG: cyclic nucleotide-binding domain-containing protein [Gammaproteobacteria bacterium]|jgi:CRP-like cAMP-binding protein/rhodanese-related sulfurtransferase
MSASLDTDLVKQLIPINALSPDRRRTLLQKARVIESPEGSRLFKKGDTDKMHYYLLEGEVELTDDSGVFKVIAAGSQDALHPLVHRQPRTATVRTTTPSRILALNSNDLDLMLTWDQTGSYQVDELDESDQQDDDWMTRLLQTKAFQRIPPANLQAIFSRMEEISCHAGDVVVRQGDPGDYFYIITEGRCAVTRTLPSKPEGIKLAELGTSDSFGEEALISNGHRNATVTMLTDGKLMRLSHEDFTALLEAPLMRHINYEEGVEKVANDHAQWLDVRLPDEYKQHHIKGSINIPLVLLRIQMAKLDPQRPYVVYCDTGRRSAAATYLLSERGFTAFLLDNAMQDVPKNALEGADT